MKKYILTLSFVFLGLVSFAQDINLSDSIIYFDNKPVAYYVKELNESTPHYNIYIISLNKELLIAAQVVKFEAPVRELKPFYYYEVIFQKEKDTFSIYHEGQAFSLELASLLKQYKLLDGNKISRNGLYKFKKDYQDNASIKAKIKDYENYLDETRYFSEQTVRDRTKPVTIVNDKIIMQDGKKIGIVVTGTNTIVGGMTPTYKTIITRDNTKAVEATMTENINPNSGPVEFTQIILPTNRTVDASKVIIQPKVKNTKHRKPENLFDISLPLNKASRNEDLLWQVCQYVENYLM
jgi:hypothetical protein